VKFLTTLILATSVKRPLIVLIMMGFVLGGAGLGVFRINFEAGLRTLFTSDDQTYRDFANLTKTFTQSETDIAVLVSSKTPLDRQALERVRDFILEAQFQDGIGGVFSIFSQRVRNPASGVLTPLLPADLSDQSAVRAALVAGTNTFATGVSLVSGDLRSTVVYLSFSPDIAELGLSSRVVRQLGHLAAKMSKNKALSFSLTGLLPLRDKIIAGLKLDQITINLLGGLLGFGVSLVMFRSFWVAVLNTITPVAALVFCLGAFGWLGLTINALSNALPVLILVLASSDSIHLTYEIRRRMGRGETLETAVKGAVIDIAPPCVLTSLTTILAFVSLLYSSSPIIRDLAGAGAVGILIALFAVLFLHPVVFLLGGRLSFIARKLPISPRQVTPLFKKELRFLSAHYRTITALGFGACLAGLAVLLPVQTRYSFLENIDASEPVVKTLKAVETISGPVNTMSIPIRLNTGVAPVDPRVLSDLDVVSKAVAGLPDVRSVVSLANLRPLMAGPTQTPTRDQISRIVNKMPPRLRSRLIGANNRAVGVVLLVPDIGSQQVARLTSMINSTLAKAHLSVSAADRVTGFLVMSSALSDSIIRQLTISFLIAAIACPVLIGFWYRRLDFGLAAVVPNILPIAVAGAGLTLLDYDLQITSALALTIAFGIALDDSIHVFNRLRLAGSGPQAGLATPIINDAMGQVSPILIATTLILSSGLIATQVSQMPMIRFFGVLSIVTFFLALICDLFLLPAILQWLGARTPKWGPR